MVTAGAAILWLCPLFACIAVAILLESGRPVFFSQTRLGLDGRHFKLLKFRKFGPAEGTGGLPVTLANDTRLTGVGKFLERTKLDELPQFWNVLKGDMAIVGPRPESLRFADCFSGPFLALLRHKPGIFGPAQAMFRNESAHYGPGGDPETTYRKLLFPAKAAIDLGYYDGRTLMRDMIWICLSIGAIFGIPLAGQRNLQPGQAKAVQ
jgi:lipopolysaccharide/colanic/teichoic acid biosynthesis glycosyltransferase